MPLALSVCLLCRRHGFLLAVSCVSLAFYYWSSGPYVLVLLTVAALSYGGAIFLQREEDARPRRRILAVVICGILSLLFYFKYSGFVSTNADAILGTDLAHMLGDVTLRSAFRFLPSKRFPI
jgi:alginate O-acetyltransferase complex protein AlgI